MTPKTEATKEKKKKEKNQGSLTQKLLNNKDHYQKREKALIEWERNYLQITCMIMGLVFRICKETPAAQQ